MEQIVEVAIRTVVIFVCLVLGFRFLGKRYLGQMNVYDLAMVMAVANGVQNAMTRGGGDVAVGLTASTTLFLLSFGLARLLPRHQTLKQALVGSPKILATQGHLLSAALAAEDVSEEEVNKALRSAGLDDISQARLVVLEVDGSMTVVPLDAGKQG